MEQMLSMHANIHFLSVVWKILMEKNKLLLIHSKFDPRGISSTYSLLYPQISANICIFFYDFYPKVSGNTCLSEKNGNSPQLDLNC